MPPPLEPAEQALLQHALTRGFLTQAQVDEALAHVAAAAAQGRPVQLVQVLRERYLAPAALPELAAVYRGHLPPSGAGQDSLTLLTDGPPPSAGPESVTVLSDAPPAPAPEGTRRIGPYEVVREIARGGMGVVYVARRPGEDKDLALKLLLNSERAEPNEVERFKIEAAAAGKLSHPNVVKIHDVGQDARGCHYMVMDYVEGDSLHGVLRRRGVMNARQAAEMTVKMARALQHAHDQRVLHRDMKPANVLVREGEPLIADFGLAKQQGASGKSLTVTGEVMGTPAYMPPEQAEGARKEVDARSDQYSLGATLYEMLTGRPPFQGQTAINVVMAVLSKPPPAPRKHRPDLDPDLEAIVLKTLSKEREDRYPDCEALAQALEAWLGQSASGGTRGKSLLVTFAAVAVLAIGAVAFAARAPNASTAAAPSASPSPAESAPPPAPPESPPPSPSPSPSVDYTPPQPAPPVAYTPPPVEPFLDESRLERVVLLDAKSLDDPKLEHLEVGQPWLVSRTPEGLRFRGNRNASPRLRLPLRSAVARNRPFLLRMKFRVTRLGRELHFGLNLCSQSRLAPRLLALAMATKATNRPNFRGVRLRYYPKGVFSSKKMHELFSPQFEGFRPAEEVTIEVRASEREFELTTLLGERVVGQEKTPRIRLDGLQAQGLVLEAGFVQSNTVHERRSKGFHPQFNTGDALLLSCELLAEPKTFTLAPPRKKKAWRLLGLAGRALARGDAPGARRLLSDPLLSPQGITEHGVHVRAGVLRALTALASEDRPLAIEELRQLDAREQERFPAAGDRASNTQAFQLARGASFWGLRTSDLPLVSPELRSLFVDAYRAHLLHPDTDLAAFAKAQEYFFGQNPDSLPGLAGAFRAARAEDLAPLAALVRARIAKTLRRDDAWGIRHQLCSWLALNLSLAEPPTGSTKDTVAGYLWQRAGAPTLGWQLLEPHLESADPLQRWVAANFGANARYCQGDHAGAHRLWKALEAEALGGPLVLEGGGVDAGVYEALRPRFQHASRMTGR